MPTNHYMTNCADAWAIMERTYREGKTPKKFPIQCRRCWKILLFDVPTEADAKAIMATYPEFLSKVQPMNDDDTKFIIVFYTTFQSRRDSLIQALSTLGIGRVQYRFACRHFQDLFSKMFISTKQADRRYL